jgi:N-acetylgalactosamine-N,N'-diacetylbacillosaminyl-diphospho-undecaprenol 4-alpha-N-acetylgalactosaminyltransferase
LKKGALYIIFSLGNGGTQRNIVNTLNNIELKNKKKILFLYNAIKTSDLENQIDESVKIYRVTSKSMFKHFIRLKVLVSIIKNENIFSIFSFALNGSYLALFSKLFFPFRKLPIIYRLVSVDSALTSSRFLIISKLKNFIFIHFLCRFVNTIICQSDFMYNSLTTQSRKFLSKKSIVIKNLIDFPRINNSLNESFKVDYEYFTFIGRLSPEKNVLQIVEAFNIIKEKSTCKLLIIGDGSEYEKIRSYVKLSNLEERVLLLGFQSNPYKYLKNSLGLILFSKYEGFPNVLLESMYCKTPVITSNFEGAEEIVNHNETGYIVERNDIASLAMHMNQISDKSKNIQLINNAYKFVLKLNNDSENKYKGLIN